MACYLYFICYRGMLHVMLLACIKQGSANLHETTALSNSLRLRFTLDKGPFYAKGECVNVDALLISTERFA